MELTEEQLLEIEQFAYKYLEKSEIALIMRLPDPAVLDEEDTPEYIAFWTGRLRRKADYNNSVIRLSDQLSSPAQNIEAKMAKEVYLNDKKKL